MLEIKGVDQSWVNESKSGRAMSLMVEPSENEYIMNTIHVIKKQQQLIPRQHAPIS